MGIDSRDADELAVERRPLVFSKRAHRAEVLGGAGPSSLHRNADRLELGLEVADAHAECEPSARDDVEAGELLGEDHRVALRQDHDACGETDPLGMRCEERKRNKPSRIGSSGSIGEGGTRGSGTTTCSPTHSESYPSSSASAPIRARPSRSAVRF
jgi:hypothetical protein